MNQPLCLGLTIACLLLAGAGPVLAQSAPPARDSKEAKDSKDTKETREAKEAREAAEAMERARRLAANPMRVILEASRVKRRTDGEAPLVPVAAATGATAAAATTAAPAAAEVAPRSLPPTPPPPPREAPPSVISSDLAQARVGTGPAPALEAPVLPSPVVDRPAELPALASLLPEISRPTLVTRVDPAIPQRLLADVDANTVVAADLTIRTDGSVAQVAIVTPNTRALGRYVVAALQQWRFAPLPSERQWRVELLFRPE